MAAYLDGRDESIPPAAPATPASRWEKPCVALGESEPAFAPAGAMRGLLAAPPPPRPRTIEPCDEPPAEIAGRLLRVMLKAEEDRPRYRSDPQHAEQLEHVRGHLPFLRDLLLRAGSDQALLRAVQYGIYFADDAIDLTRSDYEAGEAHITGSLRRRVNRGLSAAWGGLASLREDPLWATREPWRASQLLIQADVDRDDVRSHGQTTLSGTAGVQAAGVASTAAGLVELTSAAVGVAPRIVAWMKALKVESGTLQFAGAAAGVLPGFQIVATGGTLALTDAEVAALATAGQLAPGALELYLMAKGLDPHAKALGEGPEVAAMKEVGKAGAGMAAPDKHHVLPREFRKWFDAHGFGKGKKADKALAAWIRKQKWFKGKWDGTLDIDNFTVKLEQSEHQALHGGGDWKLARKEWEDEWNKTLMKRLQRRERDLEAAGTELGVKEILNIMKRLMRDRKISGPFFPYGN
jgi:hypothetical protein